MPTLTKPDLQEWAIPNYVPSNPKLLHSLDYSQFKTLPGNRPISEFHVRELAESYRAQPNLVDLRPMLVNERMEIVDGQHCLDACKLCSIPVPYIVTPGLTLSTAQLMNGLQRPWSLKNWLHSYAADGNVNYQIVERLMDEYQLGTSAMLNYIMGSEKSNARRRFKKGELVVDDREGAEDRLSKLSDWGSLDLPWQQDRFNVAFLHIMRNPEYDHDRMMKNAKLALPTIKLQANRQEWMRELERIYNYGGGRTTRLF